MSKLIHFKSNDVKVHDYVKNYQTRFNYHFLHNKMPVTSQEHTVVINLFDVVELFI